MSNRCVCGHSAWGHRGQTGVCCDGNTAFCTCTSFTPDDGTDGPPGGWGWITRDGYRYEATQAGEGVSL